MEVGAPAGCREVNGERIKMFMQIIGPASWFVVGQSHPGAWMVNVQNQAGRCSGPLLPIFPRPAISGWRAASHKMGLPADRPCFCVDVFKVCFGNANLAKKLIGQTAEKPELAKFALLCWRHLDRRHLRCCGCLPTDRPSSQPFVPHPAAQHIACSPPDHEKERVPLRGCNCRAWRRVPRRGALCAAKGGLPDTQRPAPRASRACSHRISRVRHRPCVPTRYQGGSP